VVPEQIKKTKGRFPFELLPPATRSFAVRFDAQCR
jgi:hypothetical protein